jgi:hypothetical protein
MTSGRKRPAVDSTTTCPYQRRLRADEAALQQLFKLQRPEIETLLPEIPAAATPQAATPASAAAATPLSAMIASAM